MISSQEIIRLLQAAIEASVYVEPSEPGLTATELHEVGKQLGLKQGEIDDALPRVATQSFGGRDRRLLLEDHAWMMPGYLGNLEDPDLRNPDAFDFVVTQLHEVGREMGVDNASLDREIIIARASEKSISRHDIEVAIRLMVLSKQILEDKDIIRLPSLIYGHLQLPSASLKQPNSSRIRTKKEYRTRAMPHVKDVIARRIDGRPKNAEPFGTFADKLNILDYGHFRLWWTQTVNELERTDPTGSPLSTLVLAAALVEGALTFVVKHAQTLELGVFGSTTFKNTEPRTWRIDDLVASAARGGDTAILDAQTKSRADLLILTRQRVHAGRMLSDFPQGVPDLRPEEAREGKAIAAQVVRKVLDWLEKNPRHGA